MRRHLKLCMLHIVGILHLVQGGEPVVANGRANDRSVDKLA